MLDTPILVNDLYFLILLSPLPPCNHHTYVSRCLTTCHTVVREKSGTYRAESPDELALVEGAGRYRCELFERGSKEMEVSIFGEKVTYEVLAVNPFNADRKRMSVLLLEVKTGELGSCHWIKWCYICISVCICF